MKHFTEGKYLGINKNERSIGGIILSETAYQEGFASDWHVHENSYFAFVMNGGCVETRKTESIECVPGKLLFYNWEEPHRNHHYQTGTRIFNIELTNQWLADLGVDAITEKGALTVSNPDQKFLLLKIFSEYRLEDNHSSVSIEDMTINLLASLDASDHLDAAIPKWANRLVEILHDRWQENIPLKELSVALGIHPITISRYFPKYYQCTIGEYLRKIRIDKSLGLIRKGETNLTSIAHICGFTDQSHFIKIFKKETGLLPHHYRSF
jgi:AraC family transcriptional regulator